MSRVAGQVKNFISHATPVDLAQCLHKYTCIHTRMHYWTRQIYVPTFVQVTAERVRWSGVCDGGKVRGGGGAVKVITEHIYT